MLSADFQLTKTNVGEIVPRLGAITALASPDNETLFIGTTSQGCNGAVLLRMNLRTKQITDTGLRFPDKGAIGTYAYSVGDKIHSALIAGEGRFSGKLLLGHGSHIWWDDGGWPFDDKIFSGGGLYAFDPISNHATLLGIPVQRNTVHGLFAGEGFAAGYSLPDNHFFSFDYESGKTRDFGKISGYCCHSIGCVGKKAFGVFRRSLGEQRGDIVVSNDSGAFLFCYNHETGNIERTTILIDQLKTNIRFNSGMDSWLNTPAGLLGGRVDGTLFLLEPENMTIEELGYAIKPTYPAFTNEQIRKFGGSRCETINGSERVTSMAMIDNRYIIGVAGFPKMHVFIYDLEKRNSIDLGIVNDELGMCYFHDIFIKFNRNENIQLIMAETDGGFANLYVLDMPFKKINELLCKNKPHKT